VLLVLLVRHVFFLSGVIPLVVWLPTMEVCSFSPHL
jgi:hypothetical protein